MKLTKAIILMSVLVLSSQTAMAETKANKLFGAKKSASQQLPDAFGTYAKGCLAGAEQMPETGPTWQAMRLSRNRNWGHPSMISFLKRLSTSAAAQPGWKGLYIGDISQPRGGPMTSSHQSHQLGLDADVWLLPPKRLNLSRAEREALSSKTVRSKDWRTVNGNWTPAHMEVIKAAASDPAVDRIFITAPAKVWMCKHAKGNRKWLQKVRPYWGHHYHFHVRLKCPKGSTICKTQKPTVKQLSKNATGCDKDLNWWITTALKPPDPNAPKKKKQKKRGARDYVMADLPNQCRRVLASQ
ncbi:MAG: penicillin-insensitive murein endopeptidase [Amylibacter sp.]